MRYVDLQYALTIFSVLFVDLFFNLIKNYVNFYIGVNIKYYFINLIYKFYFFHFLQNQTSLYSNSTSSPHNIGSEYNFSYG